MCSSCTFIYIIIIKTYIQCEYVKVISSCWGRGRFLLDNLIRVLRGRKFVLVRKKHMFKIRYINHSSCAPIKHSTLVAEVYVSQKSKTKWKGRETWKTMCFFKTPKLPFFPKLSLITVICGDRGQQQSFQDHGTKVR